MELYSDCNIKGQGEFLDLGKIHRVVKLCWKNCMSDYKYNLPTKGQFHHLIFLPKIACIRLSSITDQASITKSFTFQTRLLEAKKIIIEIQFLPFLLNFGIFLATACQWSPLKTIQ